MTFIFFVMCDIEDKDNPYFAINLVLEVTFQNGSLRVWALEDEKKITLSNILLLSASRAGLFCFLGSIG